MLTDPNAQTLTITTLYPNGYCLIATVDLTTARGYHLAKLACPGEHWRASDAEWASEASWSMETERHTIAPSETDYL